MINTVFPILNSKYSCTLNKSFDNILLCKNVYLIFILNVSANNSMKNFVSYLLYIFFFLFKIKPQQHRLLAEVKLNIW